LSLRIHDSDVHVKFQLTVSRLPKHKNDRGLIRKTGRRIPENAMDIEAISSHYFKKNGDMI